MLEDLDWHPRRRYCDAHCKSSLNNIYCRNWPVCSATIWVRTARQSG
jgi:hypothetical protein